MDKQENEKSNSNNTANANNVAVTNPPESKKKMPTGRDSLILPSGDSGSEKIEKSTKDTLSYLEKQKKKLVSEVHKLTEDLDNLTQSIEKLQDKKKKLLSTCGKLDEVCY